MVDFEIGYDEYIILEIEDVVWISNNDIEIDKMALTNKNIYIQYSEKGEGFFAKTERRVATMSLYGIKVIDGQLMVGHVWKWDSGTCLQIQHAKGEGLFYFRYGGKKKVIEWENEIKRIFEVDPVPDTPIESTATTLAGQFFNSVGEAFGGVLAGNKGKGQPARLSFAEGYRSGHNGADLKSVVAKAPRVRILLPPPFTQNNRHSLFLCFQDRVLRNLVARQIVRVTPFLKITRYTGRFKETGERPSRSGRSRGWESTEIP